MSKRMAAGEYWILTALAAERLHGYSLIAACKELSAGTVSLSPSTLYSTLARLQQERLVAADGDEAVDGRLRRYFVITHQGLTALAVEVAALDAMSAAGRRILGARGALA